ncbi:MAG: sugar phosphate isomerase/epimerase [Armatimonadetes bacterium]|nr:sugar phosphate isomerase/epimerase [Armatimonadota bacterium]
MSYRLGTTSYIYPDHILPNVEKLLGRVRDIELLLFETSEESNLPTPDDIVRLKELAEGRDLTYTVHLPLSIKLADPDPERRRWSVEKAMEIVRLTLPLNPPGYPVHLAHAAYEKDAAWNPDEIRDVPPFSDEEWQSWGLESLRAMIDRGAPPHLLCIENIGYPFNLTDPILDSLPVSVLIDIGHLLQNAVPIKPHLRRYLPRTRIIHLHGFENGRDHLALSSPLAPYVRTTLSILESARYNGVVTLEIFSLEDLEASLKALADG